ncbi:MAG: cytochrome c oxidase assembly protein [Sphingobacteriia bacterium]|nr:cytochrome c oxidase assembly protein [Sphingobacteriia bacterium]
MNNKKLAINMAAIVLGMFMMAYAAVPIYRVFCQVTGFGGTISQVKQKSDKIGTREIKVYFDANIDKNLPWEFKTKQNNIKALTGSNILVYFEAKNLSNNMIKGMATYNVTPLKAGKYFKKIHCFCFEEQILLPNQKVEFPVTFYVDPKLEDDHNLDDVKEITLSYTFFDITER